MSGGRIDRAAGLLLGPFLDGVNGILQRFTRYLRERRLRREEAAVLAQPGGYEVRDVHGLLLWATDDLHAAVDYADRMTRETGVGAVVLPR